MPRPSPQTDRVLAVIDLLTERHGASLTEISAAIGARPTTLQHVLAAMTSAGYLVREPSDRRYHLGPGLVQPGRIAALRYPALAVARTRMEELSRELRRPCFAFVRDGPYARLVHYTREFRHSVPSLRVGELVPMVPPLGAVFIAWSGPEETERWLAADRGLDTAHAERLRRTLAVSRELGYVVEAQPRAGFDDEVLEMLRDGPSPRRDADLRRRLTGPEEHVLTHTVSDATYRITSVGAPLFGPSGSVVLSLSVAGFDQALSGSEVHRIGVRLRRAAGDATRDLAAASPGHPGA